MHAEVIAIGSELTSGANLDTNSQWLSVELGQIGIPVRFHTTVADDLDAIVDVLRTSVARSDVVLITGGLGPTQDDLTRDALAALAGRKLVLHQPSLDHIRRLFAQRGRPMPERNRVQALFPEGSEPLPNPVGTAPGIWMELSRDGADPCRLAALPGVPSEMRRMFHEQVRPRLPRGDQVILSAKLNCFGAGESAIEEMLGELTARGRQPDVGITAHEATIVLRITAQAATLEQCRRQIDQTKALIRERLGSLIFGEEDETLPEVVVSLLRTRNKTLATLEMGTDGLLTHWLAKADPQREHFVWAEIRRPFREEELRRFSVIQCYEKRCGVERKISEVDDRMSRFMKEELHRLRSHTEADLTLAVHLPRSKTAPSTSPDQPAHVVLVAKEIERAVEEPTAGNPAILVPRVVKAALNHLRLHLLAMTK
ncbi:MAG: CinA family nicotinamide mononucleotide deamidase-related protein [Planctomycetes bacterium]|nr:CinA family nicotinamide mononucleotide deamidase-related protein [Planctomycetota bacterium]